MAGAPDAEVQLPVLAAADGLVEQADLLEHVATHDPEVGGLRLALPGSAVIRTAAEADGGVVRTRDGALERRAPVRAHDPADIGGTDPPEGRERPHGVSRLQLRMRVDANDDRVGAGPDREIQAHGDVGVGIVHDAHPRIIRRKLRRDLLGPVGGRGEGQDEL